MFYKKIENFAPETIVTPPKLINEINSFTHVN
jgi:hypothetical protein